MEFSLNDRLVLEQYVKQGLKAETRGGIATPDQKDGLKGLRVLVGTVFSDGRQVPKGSIAYIREEVLHSHPWASKVMKCDFLSEKFIIAERSYIEFIVTPQDAA